MQDRTDRIMRIVETAEARFGRPVQNVTAPGGGGRSSFRLHFHEGSVIATFRSDPRRTRLEAYVLRRLSERCDDVPECLGTVGDVMFQSDVGRRRLSKVITHVDPPRRNELAARAVAGLFRIQSAARQAKLAEVVPRLGTDPAWVASLVNAVDALEPFSHGISDRFDRAAACEVLGAPGSQFVKWDCRAGNAALTKDGRLRWFDFEFSGLRHGAEDFAWLIGDEAWPVAPDKMIDLVIDAFDPGCGQDIAEWLEYLSVYLTFHCAVRLRLILQEARLRGWLSKARVLEFDDAGVHPDFTAQLCRVGRYFAAQTRLTAPLTTNFDTALANFKSGSAGSAGQKGG